MRPVSPIFSQSNPGGPFSPLIIGGSYKISNDSFLFLDGSNLNTAIKLSMPSTPVQSSSKVYLNISFKNGIYEKSELIAGDSWWDSYPNVVKYSSEEKKIDKQTNLYACVFSVFNASSFGVNGQFVNTSAGEMLVYRHITTNLMIMQSCKYFFLLPAPCAPQMK
jgi:hypothetical protein